jgi:hypothetical protein
MRRRVKKDVDAEVLAIWRARFALVGEKLAANPSSESAWFWRVQWDILNYLLHRYGGDEKQSQPALAQAVIGTAVAAPNPTVFENQPSGAFAAYAGLGKMPRASGQMRPILGKIVQKNRERYELLNRLRDEMLEATRRLSDQTREWPKWAKDYLAKYSFLEETAIEPPELTDDEIVEMLSKMIDMDETRGASPGA